MTMRETRRYLATLLMAGLALGACVTAPEPAAATETSSDAEALRALSNSEILGAVSFGQSVTFQYQSYFRAYAITARAGDVIDATVSSGSLQGRPWLWLTTGRGQSTNLAKDENSSRDTTARIQYTVRNAGTYYLVVRDAWLRKQDMTLRVAALPPPPPCDPDENPLCTPQTPGAPLVTDDPWLPGSCTGQPTSFPTWMEGRDLGRSVIYRGAGSRNHYAYGSAGGQPAGEVVWAAKIIAGRIRVLMTSQTLSGQALDPLLWQNARFGTTVTFGPTLTSIPGTLSPRLLDQIDWEVTAGMNCLRFTGVQVGTLGSWWVPGTRFASVLRY